MIVNVFWHHTRPCPGKGSIYLKSESPIWLQQLFDRKRARECDLKSRLAKHDSSCPRHFPIEKASSSSSPTRVAKSFLWPATSPFVVYAELPTSFLKVYFDSGILIANIATLNPFTQFQRTHTHIHVTTGVFAWPTWQLATMSTNVPGKRVNYNDSPTQTEAIFGSFWKVSRIQNSIYILSEY